MTPLSPHNQRRTDGTARAPVTIMDVARYCGLSKATVSKALNLPPDRCPLKRETRDKVLHCAKELGYLPNWRAKALASQRTHTIGLLYSPPSPQVGGAYDEIFTGFTVRLNAAGYHLLHVPVRGHDDDWREVLLSHRLDGWVALESVPEVVEETLEDTVLSAVLLNGESKLPIPRVMFDDHDGAVQATQHLLELGHRRVTFFHGPEAINHCSVEARIAGYRDAMTRAGLRDHIDVADTMLDEFADRLLRPDRPTAVLCYIHYFAIDLLGILARHGVRVPQDISLIGFNDIYPAGRLFPSLTSVALPGEWMGRLSAELLLQQIESKQPIGPECFTLKERLVIRESTAPPPA